MEIILGLGIIADIVSSYYGTIINIRAVESAATRMQWFVKNPIRKVFCLASAKANNNFGYIFNQRSGEVLYQDE